MSPTFSGPFQATFIKICSQEPHLKSSNPFPLSVHLPLFSFTSTYKGLSLGALSYYILKCHTLKLASSPCAGPRLGVTTRQWALMACSAGINCCADCTSDGSAAVLPREPPIPLHCPVSGAPCQEWWVGLRYFKVLVYYYYSYYVTTATDRVKFYILKSTL